MNIMIAINRAFMEYACVMLMSLKEHHRGIPLHVYILYSELRDDDFQRMDEVIGPEGIELIPVYIPKGTAGDFEINGWVEESSFRLLAADIFDDSVDRVLHLDVDILINGDITEFYETDFEDNYLAACKDFMTDEVSRQKNRDYGRTEDIPWFNTGVLLFNVRKLRQAGIGFAYYREVLLTNKNLNIKYPDQDVLNLVFAGKIKYMDDIRYNYSPLFYKMFDQEHFYDTREELNAHCSIVHMAGGGTAPWNTILEMTVYDIWWEYAKRTPFYFDMKKRHVERMAAAYRQLNAASGITGRDREPVSIIIPTYNRENTIADAVKSVLQQTYTDFELLIVDDGSTDRTEQVVKAIQDERIRYIQMPENRGVAAARNEGIRQARYDYIAFQDSDDKWLPEKLEKEMKLLSEQPEAGLVYCAFSYQNADGDTMILPGKKIPTEEKSGNIYPYMLRRNTIDTPTALVRKACLLQTGLFNEKLSCLEDWELFLRIAKEYEIGYVDEVLMQSNMRTAGVSQNMAGYFDARCYVVSLHREELLKRGMFDEVVEDILNRAKDNGVLELVMKLFQLYLK